MPSETDLINDSLSQIGAATVTAIDDGSINSNIVQRLYPALRDAHLRRIVWNFALKRAELAQDADAPAFEFAFQYTLPADLLKVVEYNGTSFDVSNLTLFEALRTPLSRYKVEGRKLLTNDGEVKIVYIARITDPNQWDTMFYQGMAAALASKLALAIPKDEKKARQKMDEAEGWFMLAAAVAGQEGTIIPYQSDDLLWGR